jgi:hypothetical protein
VAVVLWLRTGEPRVADRRFFFSMLFLFSFVPSSFLILLLFLTMFFLLTVVLLSLAVLLVAE